MKRIIIIGGMGPQASVELHRRVVAMAAQIGTGANHDYPEIIHYSLPVVDFIDDETSRPDALRRIVGAVRQARPWLRRYLHLGVQYSAHIIG